MDTEETMKIYYSDLKEIKSLVLINKVSFRQTRGEIFDEAHFHRCMMDIQRNVIVDGLRSNDLPSGGLEQELEIAYRLNKNLHQHFFGLNGKIKIEAPARYHSYVVPNLKQDPVASEIVLNEHGAAIKAAATVEELVINKVEASSESALASAEPHTAALHIQQTAIVPPSAPRHSVAPAPAFSLTTPPMPASANSIEPPPRDPLDLAEIARRRALILSNCASAKEHRGLPQLPFNPYTGLPELCKTIRADDPIDVVGGGNRHHNKVENLRPNHPSAIRYAFDSARPDGKSVLYLWIDHKYGSKVEDEKAEDSYWELNNFLNWYATIPVAGRRNLWKEYYKYWTFPENDARCSLPGNYRDHPVYKATMRVFGQKHENNRLAHHTQGSFSNRSRGGYQGRGGGRGLGQDSGCRRSHGAHDDGLGRSHPYGRRDGGPGRGGSNRNGRR